jgi:Ca2+-binding RTX toxin-like protein
VDKSGSGQSIWSREVQVHFTLHFFPARFIRWLVVLAAIAGAWMLLSASPALAAFGFIDEWVCNPSGGSCESIAIDPTNNRIYVGQTGVGKIDVFGPSGEFITSFGGGIGTANGQFTSRILGLGVEDSGEIWAADTDGHRIQRFLANGTFSVAHGSPTNNCGTATGAKHCFPTDVDTDPSDNIYSAENGYSQVHRFNSSRQIQERENMSGPWGLEADASHLYVSELSVWRVNKMSGLGTGLTSVDTFGEDDGDFDYTDPGELYDPRGLGLDPTNSDVYVAEASGQEVSHYDSNGNFIKEFGNAGSGFGQFSFPMDVDVASTRDVFVADPGRQRILRFGETDPCNTPGTDTITDNDADADPATADDQNLAAGAIQGTTGDDVICGDADPEVIRGNEGADRIFAQGGGDRAYGDEGRDIVNGGADSDRLFGGPDSDRMLGEDGNDAFDRRTGAASLDALTDNTGPDRFEGGNGIDHIYYNLRTARIGLFIGDGSANDGDLDTNEQDEILGDVENGTTGSGDDYLWDTSTTNNNAFNGGSGGGDWFIGGDGNDVLVGNNGGDYMEGRDGSDVLNAGDDSDQLYGANGNDRLLGGDAGDHLQGDADDDTLVPGNDDDADNIQGEGGRDSVYYNDRSTNVRVSLNNAGDDGGDTGSGPGSEGDNVRSTVEDVYTGSGEDNIFGSGQPNRIDTAAGDDEARGGGGVDRLYTGAGDDVLRTNGDGLRDYLYCGEGSEDEGGDRFFADFGLDFLAPGECEIDGNPPVS